MKITNVGDKRRGDRQSCVICDKVLNPGDRYRYFENRSIDEAGVEVSHEIRHFRGIYNQYLLFICTDCFNPPERRGADDKVEYKAGISRKII